MSSIPTRLPDWVKAALWPHSRAGLAVGVIVLAASLTGVAFAEKPSRGCKGSSWEGGVRVPTSSIGKG